MNSVSHLSFQTTYIIWSSCEKLPIMTYIIGGPRGGLGALDLI